jgi:hypothetical protein
MALVGFGYGIAWLQLLLCLTWLWRRLAMALVGFGYGVAWLWLRLAMALVGRHLLGFAPLLFGFGSYSLAMAWLWWAWIRYDYGATVQNAVSSNL